MEREEGLWPPLRHADPKRWQGGGEARRKWEEPVRRGQVLEGWSRRASDRIAQTGQIGTLGLMAGRCALKEGLGTDVGYDEVLWKGGAVPGSGRPKWRRRENRRPGV